MNYQFETIVSFAQNNVHTIVHTIQNVYKKYTFCIVALETDK